MDNSSHNGDESNSMPILEGVPQNTSRLGMDREVDHEVDTMSDLTLLTQYTDRSGSLQRSLLREDEKTMDEEQKKDLLIRCYAILPPTTFNVESLNTIRLIVNREIVSSVKFIRNEHVDGKTKQLKDKTKQFPSFWQPDLRQGKTMYTDILDQVGNLKHANLQTKVMYWLGIQDKVLETIHSHRSNTLTKMKRDIVEGNYRCVLVNLLRYEKYALI